MNPARTDRRRAKLARQRKLARENGLGLAINPVAFAREAEARQALDLNPNRGKRRASKAGLNLDDPASAGRERVSRNQYRRVRGQTARTPYLETRNARIPALGSTLSKRVPRA